VDVSDGIGGLLLALPATVWGLPAAGVMTC
jgi:hypothetical protein